MRESSALGRDRSTWPEEAQYLFEERAAIMEFMQGFGRAVAQKGAEQYVREVWSAPARKEGDRGHLG